jgi:alpha-ketoglutaric semialdehyde dehydrogenase
MDQNGVGVVGKQFINGEWIESSAPGSTEVRNPANLDEVVGVWPDGDRVDARRAVAAASATFPSWKAMPAIRRADLLKRVLSAMDRRRDEIARAITMENGKTLKDSHAEVQSSYRELEYQIAEGVRLPGEMRPANRKGIMAYQVRVPLGVVSVICPWNYPFSVPCRKVPPALMAGNTVVMKPSGLTPGVGKLFVELFEEAGFPPGVINMVCGGGSTVGAELTTAPEIRAISFTGSTGVGRCIHQTAAAGMKRTQLEMGGKNAIVVLKDADIDTAARAAVTGAYACAGQWCTATSRAIVESSVVGDFTDRVRELAQTLTVGDGFDEAVDMGPVCGATQLKTVLDYIEIGKNENARLIAGGSRITDGALANGCFIAPTVFDRVTPEMTIAREEIFGPLLSIMSVDDFDHAIRVANATDFGLSASVFTRDLGKAMSFVDQVEVGMVHVNEITAYKEPAFSFGGVKDSGYGIPEAGETGIEFFTEHKVVYVNYNSGGR